MQVAAAATKITQNTIRNVALIRDPLGNYAPQNTAELKRREKRNRRRARMRQQLRSDPAALDFAQMLAQPVQDFFFFRGAVVHFPLDFGQCEMNDIMVMNL